MPDDKNAPQAEGDAGDFQTAFTQAGDTAASDSQPANPTPEPAVSGEPQGNAAEPQPAAQTEPAPQPEPQVSEFAKLAGEAGLSVDGLSDQEIAYQMASELQKLKPYADYGQQIAPYADQINEYFSTNQSEPDPAGDDEGKEKPVDWSSEDYFSQKWKDPEWNEQWDFAEQAGIVMQNPETGLYEAAPGREVMAGPILQGMNQALLSKQQQWQQITASNPYKHFYDVLLEPMQKAWQGDLDRLVQAKLAEREQVSFVNQFEADNSEWLFQDDQAGNQSLSAKGQAFYDTVSELRDSGISDPQKLVALAGKIVNANAVTESGNQAAQQAPPAQQQPVPAVEQANEQKQGSFLENAMERARHSPNAGGYTQQAPSDPVNADETELNSMFSRSYRASESGT